MISYVLFMSYIVDGPMYSESDSEYTNEEFMFIFLPVQNQDFLFTGYTLCLY